MIHLVERAPPQPGSSGSGGAGSSTGGDTGPSTSHSSTTTQGIPHDRNGNSYVMLGTFNLPVNIMDPQQIQVRMKAALLFLTAHLQSTSVDGMISPSLHYYGNS